VATTTAASRFNTVAGFRVRPDRILRSRGLLAAVLCAAVVVAIAIVQSDSFSEPYSSLLFQGVLPLLFAGFAQMFVILAGDIDISIGAAVGLVNVISATWLVTHPLLGVAALCGVAIGYVLMGLLVQVSKVPAIVVTLGMSFVWLGIALMIEATPGGTCPTWLFNALNVSTPLLPEAVYIVILTGAVGWFGLNRTRYGAVLRGFGNNPTAVEATGRSRTRARCVTYLLAGIFVIASGVATTFVSQGADANGSSTITLVSVAAVIIGGAEFSGGIVVPAGVALTAVSLSLISSLLAFLNVPSTWDTAAQGAVLLIALTFRRIESLSNFGPFVRRRAT
jgi:ribose/xylose/arabinose/galactoside ABC-type transport system permease subunit